MLYRRHFIIYLSIQFSSGFLFICTSPLLKERMQPYSLQNIDLGYLKPNPDSLVLVFVPLSPPTITQSIPFQIQILDKGPIKGSQERNFVFAFVFRKSSIRCQLLLNLQQKLPSRYYVVHV